MKEYFTLEECMEQLGLKRSAILKRLKEGELEPVYENIPKKGGRRHISNILSLNMLLPSAELSITPY